MIRPAGPGTVVAPGYCDAVPSSRELADRGRRRVTIEDVAAHAGVSPSTVSRVLNGQATVDPKLAARVRSASEQLQYRPSATAQGLVRGSTRTVGVVVPDLGNPFFPDVLKGLTLAAGSKDFSVLVADADEDPEAEARLVDDLLRRADGLVLCSPRMPLPALRTRVGRGVPVVCTNRPVPQLPVSSALIDSAMGMRMALDHLIGLGHRRVAYLSGPSSSWSNGERLSALRVTALQLHTTVVVAGPKSHDGHRVAEQAVQSGATALVAFNDLVALGAMARLRELGVSVPEEMSVVGFDDIATTEYVVPALTSVRLPKAELGRRSWELLQEELSQPAVSRTPRSIWLEPELVVRGSTARAVDRST